VGRLTVSVLLREFFDRPVLSVAPDLLGCVLEHETGDGLVAAEIVEVEAYAGGVDPASHAFRGQTERNAVMFGEPGHAYVYFTYGMHYCVNLVCQPAGVAAAVLLRAGRVIEGADLAAARRLLGPGARAGDVSPARLSERELARGPARLCQALGIGRTENGADVCDPDGPLRVLERRDLAGRTAMAIERGPRVGVRNGATREWRFWLAGEPTVSSYRPHVPRRAARPGVSSAGNYDVTSRWRGGSMQR
jgi:DNA-3-methyladenine glycosylase